MRVLSISTLFPTPNALHHGVFVFNRVNAMAELNGVEVDMVSPIPTSPFHRRIRRYNAQQKCPSYWERGNLTINSPRYFSLPGIAKSLERFTLKQKLLRSIDPSSFDVIDVHWTYPDLPAALALSQHHKKPIAVTLRGMEAFYGVGGARHDCVARSLKHVDAVISLSDEMADYADSIAQTASRTSIVINGGAPDVFYHESQRDTQAELGLSQGKIHVLGVGSLIKRKGFHRVIPTLSSIAKSTKQDIVYHIVGGDNLEGDDGRMLVALAERHEHVNFSVNFAGRASQDALRTWYNAVDCFVLSSLGEGSPNVLTEALLCGTPTVAVQVGSSGSIMNQGVERGNFLVGNDCKGLDYGLHQMIGNIVSRNTSKGDTLRQFNSKSRAKFDWAWCASRHAQCLEGALK